MDLTFYRFQHGYLNCSTPVLGRFLQPLVELVWEVYDLQRSHDWYMLPLGWNHGSNGT